MSERVRFMAFIGILMIVLAVDQLAGLEWFYAGFFFGTIVGGLLFQAPLRRRGRA
jgi:hypothetical protein